MTAPDSKVCAGCGGRFTKKPKERPSAWACRKTCGQEACISKSKGLRLSALKPLSAIVVPPPPPVVKKLVGHENGVPVRRVERGVGYGD